MTLLETSSGAPTSAPRNTSLHGEKPAAMKTHRSQIGICSYHDG